MYSCYRSNHFVDCASNCSVVVSTLYTLVYRCSVYQIKIYILLVYSREWIWGLRRHGVADGVRFPTSFRSHDRLIYHKKVLNNRYLYSNIRYLMCVYGGCVLHDDAWLPDSITSLCLPFFDFLYTLLSGYKSMKSWA